MHHMTPVAKLHKSYSSLATYLNMESGEEINEIVSLTFTDEDRV